GRSRHERFPDPEPTANVERTRGVLGVPAFRESVRRVRARRRGFDEPRRRAACSPRGAGPLLRLLLIGRILVGEVGAAGAVFEFFLMGNATARASLTSSPNPRQAG